MAAEPLHDGYNGGVAVLPEVDADVELPLQPCRGRDVVDNTVLSEGYECDGEPRVRVLPPLAEHLPPPPRRVPAKLPLDHGNHPRIQRPPGGQRLRVGNNVPAETRVGGVVHHPVEDGVPVPRRALGYQVAPRRVQGEEDRGVQLLVLPDEVRLHHVDGACRVPPDRLRHRRLSQQRRPVAEPDHRVENPPAPPADHPEKLRVPHLHPGEVLRERPEGYVLRLLKLWCRHQNPAPRVAKRQPEELRHTVEGLTRLPRLNERHEVAPIPEKRPHIRVGLEEQPLPAEPHRVSRENPLRPRSPAPTLLQPLPQAPYTHAQAPPRRRPAP